MTSAQHIFLTFDQYLELESLSEVRHEFVGGRMFAMVGASDAHNVLTNTINVLLYSLAAKNSCQAYVSDMKLKIDQSIYYPDVMVTCEPYSAKSLYKQSPCVLVEVLSPSTVDVDRREKLAAYKQIPSLVDYLVVYQDVVKVEHYFRNKEGWQMAELTEGALKLVAFDAPEIELSAIYARTDLLSS